MEGCHILQPLEQMHNRGNGKGGGISAVGLCPEQLGVDRQTLESHYLIQVAYLRDEVRQHLEEEFINKRYDVRSSHMVPISSEPKLLARLEVRPPTVVRYFCRAKKDVLDQFIAENEFQEIARDQVEDEYISQTSFEINQKFYANNAMQAFVMSQGRNMLIMKIVGYAEDVIRYYKMEDFKANIWIGHQRYPTKGRVWHPGGAHPFMGLDEALVHNGDLANYVSITEYLAQKGIKPMFLTDTEVAVLLFDLLNRTYGYPLEYILEALAPTTERDFHQLSEEKQKIYRAIQSTHLHRSPDGPWFFIISRNDHYHDKLQLIGITDTSMLRPQVFALVEGEMQIGLIASEKQAIDSALLSLAGVYKSLPLQADMYWNARGGSHTDGGSFIFNLGAEVAGKGRPLTCNNKFGARVYRTGKGVRHGLGRDHGAPAAPWQEVRPGGQHAVGNDRAGLPDVEAGGARLERPGHHRRDLRPVLAVGQRRRVPEEDRPHEHGPGPQVPDREAAARKDNDTVDRRHRSDAQVGTPRRVRQVLIGRAGRFEELPVAGGAERAESDGDRLRRIAHGRGRGSVACHLPGGGAWLEEHHHLRDDGTEVLRLRTGPLAPRASSWTSTAARGTTWRPVWTGPRSPYTATNRPGSIECAGLGKFVVHGDVGQKTFMYGAKGGNVYIRGNAAGRPLINAVGKPRVVINGTCLDYLAEWIMAGDPLNGGGFVVLNGLGFDADGNAFDMAEPYSGRQPVLPWHRAARSTVRDPNNKVDGRPAERRSHIEPLRQGLGTVDAVPQGEREPVRDLGPERPPREGRARRAPGRDLQEDRGRPHRRCGQGSNGSPVR